MNTRRYLPLILLLVMALSCNLPFLSVKGKNNLPSPATATDTSAPGQPAETAAPAQPATATNVSTPSVPQITPISAAVNCRSGADISFAAVTVINLGQFAQIAGKNSDGSWWYVQNPNNPGTFCWVSASVVTASGNLAGIGVVASPPTTVPTAAPIMVTNVDVGASVSFNQCGGPNPVVFNGSITTNGATKVSFQWEITGAKSNTTAPQSLTFKGPGTKIAPNPGTWTADCGKYTVTLHVLSPNNTSASKNFKIGP